MTGARRLVARPISRSLADSASKPPRNRRQTERFKAFLSSRRRRTPVALKIKSRLDILMDNPPPWTNHDIRRTVRSGLSRLKISEEAREAVLADVRPGNKGGTYDHHDYLDEAGEAKLTEVIREGGFKQVRKATAGPFNIVLEARA